MFLCPYSRSIALTTASVQPLVYTENASGWKLRRRKPPHAEFAGCARTENRSQASGTSARSDTGFVQEKNCLDGDTKVCRNIRACLTARKQQGGLHVVSEHIGDSTPIAVARQVSSLDSPSRHPAHNGGSFYSSELHAGHISALNST